MTEQHDRFTPGFGNCKFGKNFFQSAIPNPDIVVEKLRRGTSVALLDISGIGKTSLLAEARERLRANGKKVFWIDLNANGTPAKILTAILRSMQSGSNKDIIAGLMNWVQESELITAEVKTEISANISGTATNSIISFDEEFVHVFFSQIGFLFEAQESDQKPIIILAELSTLIKNTIERSKPEERQLVVGRLNSFLGQLRYWRTSEVGISMAVSGSVSFSWLQREYGIRSDLINDCVRVYIEELDRKGAKELLHMCVSSETPLNWSEQLIEEVLDFLPAYYPGIVQLAFEIVNPKSDSITKLDDSTRMTLYRALCDHFFDQFETHFERYSTPERIRINKLFDALESQAGETIETKEVFKILNGVEMTEDEAVARGIFGKLRTDPFVHVLLDGIRYTSGLVPAWRNNKPLHKSLV